jgi:3-hydroxyisobutyrate dehydrogenase-like beta-hydroxyacid dehydrogenase
MSTSAKEASEEPMPASDVTPLVDGAARLAVGFVGLGVMGWPMAANIALAGFPVFVHNRTRERADEFARSSEGVTVCASPAEVAAFAEVILTMLADGRAVDDVYLGEMGLLAGANPGAVFVDMSTIGPEHAAGLGTRVEEAGFELVDAPVSGSVAKAKSATLLVMAGGSEDAVARVRPVLEAMGSMMHVGPSGSGATMKLAVNTVVYGLNQSISEALVLAERSGLDRRLAYEVFANSAVGAPFVHYRRAAFERPGEVPVAFRAELASRDLRLILELGAKVGADLRQAETNLEVLDQAVDAGFGNADVSAVASFLRDKNPVPPSGIPERGG